MCYAGLAVLGTLGGLDRRRALTLTAVAGIWLLLVAHACGLDIVSQERLLRFAFLFLLGSLCHLYARRIPIHAALAGTAAAVLLIALCTTADYRVLAAPALAYLCLYAAVVRPPTVAPRRLRTCRTACTCTTGRSCRSSPSPE